MEPQTETRPQDFPTSTGRCYWKCRSIQAHCRFPKSLLNLNLRLVVPVVSIPLALAMI